MRAKLNAAREALERAGLLVSPHLGPGGLVVGRREERVLDDAAAGAEMSVLEDVARLRPSGGGWLFFKWAFAPGPGPHDIAFLSPTLEHGVAVALEYYAGTPTTLEGWVVPCHKHPEWNLDLLAERVAEASELEEAAWRGVLEASDRAHAALCSAPDGRLDRGWPEVARVSWTCVRHSVRADKALWLRRDLGEAWIAPSASARPRAWGWFDPGPEGWLQ